MAGSRSRDSAPQDFYTDTAKKNEGKNHVDYIIQSYFYYISVLQVWFSLHIGFSAINCFRTLDKDTGAMPKKDATYR